MRFTLLTKLWLGALVLSAAAFFVFDSWIPLVVLMVLLLGLLTEGMTAWDQDGGAHYRLGEVISGRFPARKRFRDEPAVYDEAVWEREMARLAALRDGDGAR